MLGIGARLGLRHAAELAQSGSAGARRLRFDVARGRGAWPTDEASRPARALVAAARLASVQKRGDEYER